MSRTGRNSQADKGKPIMPTWQMGDSGRHPGATGTTVTTAPACG